MEAYKLKTLDDLLTSPDERIELISRQSRAGIPPFDSVELDLAYILGE